MTRRVLRMTEQQCSRAFRRNHLTEFTDLKRSMNKSPIHIGQRMQKRVVRRRMKCNRCTRLGEHSNCESHALKNICKVMHPIDVNFPVVFGCHSIHECVTCRRGTGPPLLVANHSPINNCSKAIRNRWRHREIHISNPRGETVRMLLPLHPWC